MLVVYRTTARESTENPGNPDTIRAHDNRARTADRGRDEPTSRVREQPRDNRARRTASDPCPWSSRKSTTRPGRPTDAGAPRHVGVAAVLAHEPASVATRRARARPKMRWCPSH